MLVLVLVVVLAFLAATRCEDVPNDFGTFSFVRMLREFSVDSGFALVDWKGIVRERFVVCGGWVGRWVGGERAKMFTG